MQELYGQIRFLAAPYYSRDEVFAELCPVPKSAGVYGWWFSEIPAFIDISRCESRDGLTLLYAGISPSRPPANGKRPSSQNLCQRIRHHYNGNAEVSTLRKTIGTLLPGDLGIELRRVGSGKRRTFGHSGEAALTPGWLRMLSSRGLNGTSLGCWKTS